MAGFASTLRGMVVLMPDSVSDRLKALLMSNSVGTALLHWYSRNVMDVYIVSYPKCGRTWLRLLIGKVLCLHYQLDLDNDEIIELDRVTRAIGVGRVPAIGTTHDDVPHTKTVSELNEDKSAYAGKKVLLVIRDLRDAMVSSYFHQTRRSGLVSKDTTLSEFLRLDRGGCDPFVRYHNIWWENRGVPDQFLVVRYEDLHSDPHAVLRQVLDFFGVADVSDAHVDEAIEYASFDSLRKLESDRSFSSEKMRATDPSDPESRKIRKGKAGGYLDYMSSEDIEFSTGKLSELNSGYGYTP